MAPFAIAPGEFLAMVSFARVTPPITTDSDFAVDRGVHGLATRGRLLVGPYSRFGWNHPGPFYFYFQAPLYALSGHKAASLYAGALAINLLRSSRWPGSCHAKSGASSSS